MRVLLDTHVLLWWLADDTRLGDHTRAAIADGRNDVFVSSVSIAEIAVKRSLGKLDVPPDLFGVLALEAFDELPLLARHAAALESLPWHHRDPFDRMLIAQALTENLTLASSDDSIARYAVATLSD